MLPNRAEISSLFKYFFAILGIIAFSLLFQQNVSAAVRCETQYGGTQVCVTTGQLQVNKRICDPNQGSCDPSSAGFANRLVDNLGPGNHLFAPGEEVTFRLSIKNVGDATLTNVAVSDTPQGGFFLTQFDPLNFNLTNLNPGETREKDIKLKIADSGSIPDNNIICVVNAVNVSSDNTSDRDTSQLCLERKVLGVQAKELPRTGLPSVLWLVSGLVPLGFRLRRFAVNHKNEVGKASYIYQVREFLKGGGEI